jgi:hypothetical protein
MFQRKEQFYFISFHISAHMHVSLINCLSSHTEHKVRECRNGILQKLMQVNWASKDRNLEFLSGRLFEIGSHYICHAGFKLSILLSLS